MAAIDNEDEDKKKQPAVNPQLLSASSVPGLSGKDELDDVVDTITNGGSAGSINAAPPVMYDQENKAFNDVFSTDVKSSLQEMLNKPELKGLQENADKITGMMGDVKPETRKPDDKDPVLMGSYKVDDKGNRVESGFTKSQIEDAMVKGGYSQEQAERATEIMAEMKKDGTGSHYDKNGTKIVGPDAKKLEELTKILSNPEGNERSITDKDVAKDAKETPAKAESKGVELDRLDLEASVAALNMFAKGDDKFTPKEMDRLQRDGGPADTIVKYLDQKEKDLSKYDDDYKLPPEEKKLKDLAKQIKNEKDPEKALALTKELLEEAKKDTEIAKGLGVEEKKPEVKAPLTVTPETPEERGPFAQIPETKAPPMVMPETPEERGPVAKAPIDPKVEAVIKDLGTKGGAIIADAAGAVSKAITDPASIGDTVKDIASKAPGVLGDGIAAVQDALGKVEQKTTTAALDQAGRAIDNFGKGISDLTPPVVKDAIGVAGTMIPGALESASSFISSVGDNIKVPQAQQPTTQEPKQAAAPEAPKRNANEFQDALSQVRGELTVQERLAAGGPNAPVTQAMMDRVQEKANEIELGANRQGDIPGGDRFAEVSATLKGLQDGNAATIKDMQERKAATEKFVEAQTKIANVKFSGMDQDSKDMSVSNEVDNKVADFSKLSTKEMQALASSETERAGKVEGFATKIDTLATFNDKAAEKANDLKAKVADEPSQVIDQRLDSIDKEVAKHTDRMVEAAGRGLKNISNAVGSVADAANEQGKGNEVGVDGNLGDAKSSWDRALAAASGLMDAGKKFASTDVTGNNVVEGHKDPEKQQPTAVPKEAPAPEIAANAGRGK